MPLIVLESSWQWARLWWYESDGWLAVTDRIREQLDDATVDRRFGSEAFRRRDELVSRGLENADFDPLGAPLVGRSVTEGLSAAGWRVDDEQNYRWVAERDADSLCAELVRGRLQVRVHVDGELAEGETMDLGALERALCVVAIGEHSPREALEGVLQTADRRDR